MSSSTQDESSTIPKSTGGKGKKSSDFSKEFYASFGEDQKTGLGLLERIASIWSLSASLPEPQFKYDETYYDRQNLNTYLEIFPAYQDKITELTQKKIPNPDLDWYKQWVHMF